MSVQCVHEALRPFGWTTALSYPGSATLCWPVAGKSMASPAPLAGCGGSGFKSPAGACKTFRNDVEGHGRGESLVIVVLKRLVGAINGNGALLAVVHRSVRTNCAVASSITQIQLDSQVKVFERS